MTDFLSHGPADRVGLLALAQQRSRTAAVSAPTDNQTRAPDSQLKASCAEMESLFLYHLLEKMRATIEKTDLFGGGRSEEMYTSMLDSETAKNLASAGGIGLAKVLEQQLAMTRVKTPGEEPNP